MRSFVRGAGTALALALGACADRPAGPAPEATAAPGRGPAPIASFVATITPPSRGPGMGPVPGHAVFEILPEGRDGHSGTNPPRTIEIVGAAFTWQEETWGCWSGAITSPVRITNYLPERLADLHVAFNINDAEHPLCWPGTQPVGADYVGTSNSSSVDFDPPPAGAGPSGYLNYVLPDQFPRNALAGSPVDDGSLPGGTATVDWDFAFPVPDAPPFTLRGDVWADLYPARPIRLYGRTWSALETETLFRWLVEDIMDRWPTLDGPRVNHADARICSVPFDAKGECPAPDGQPVWSWVGGSEGYVPSSANFAYIRWFDGYLPPTLVPGRTYHLRIVNVWDSDSNAATPMVKGSLAIEQPFVVVGRPTPTGDAGPGRFSWTVDHPLVTTPAPDRPVMLVCPTSECTTAFSFAPRPIFQADTEWSAVETSPGSGIYRFTVDAEAVEAALLAYDPTPAGRTYWWTIRNLHADEEGPWSTPTMSFWYDPRWPWPP